MLINIKMSRTPLFIMLNHHILSYPTPINLDWSWNYGSLAGVCLVAQIVTGIILAMSYNVGTTYHSEGPFEAVQHILREVAGGLWTRVAHQNCATLFFLVMYIHMWRTIRQSSQTKPREMLWIIGVIILLVAFITAFLGYVLPWGQMSFWGATVITNLVSVVPFIGDYLLWWLWGSFNVDHATLKKFFSLHYLLPFLILALTFLHLIALHQNGSSNPLGLDGTPRTNIKFSPYYVIKDYLGLFVFFFAYLYLVFFEPDLAGHPDNYLIANPMVTPSHIVPEWYFLPYFAILRSIDNKTMGVLLLLFSIFVLILVPYINRPLQRASSNRPGYMYIFWLQVVIIFYLGYIGGCEAVEPYLTVGRLCMIMYFVSFIILIPLQVVYENYLFEYRNKHR
jgi:ubiquinol-cytochrome c reductase cytochrome b subunit